VPQGHLAGVGCAEPAAGAFVDGGCTAAWFYAEAAVKVAFDPQQFRWEGIQPAAYKFSLGEARGMGWRRVHRFTLASGIPAAFELRYFELEPGGYSSFEKHRHVHFILVLRGCGRAVVGPHVFDLAPFDLLYVPPMTPHRWVNEGEEPFGFVCPVDAERDPPQPLDDAEWTALRENPETAPYAF
jgi:quercetin dioxygenase-like cupin family protein